MKQYYADAKAGKLPQVAFVESSPLGDVNTESDEHPPANVQVGQKFTHDVIKALIASPNWSSSALFLTYDEHGGFYDHVPPPAAPKPDNIPPMLKPGDTPGAFDRYGIRVPTIVVSPYAKKHYVSHTVYDHTSILRFIETALRAAGAHEARQGRRPDARHVQLHQDVEPEAEPARRARRPGGQGRLHRAPPAELTGARPANTCSAIGTITGARAAPPRPPTPPPCAATWPDARPTAGSLEPAARAGTA